MAIRKEKKIYAVIDNPDTTKQKTRHTSHKDRHFRFFLPKSNENPPRVIHTRGWCRRKNRPVEPIRKQNNKRQKENREKEKTETGETRAARRLSRASITLGHKSSSRLESAASQAMDTLSLPPSLLLLKPSRQIYTIIKFFASQLLADLFLCNFLGP